MTYESHKETRKGFTIRILSDDDPLNPFTDQDGLPDIVTFLRSYDFTTDPKTAGNDPESFLEKAKAGGYFFRPLRAYIHGGIAFSLTDGGQFSDAFDSGFAGFIYWTPEKRESLGITDSYINSILHDGETLESWLAAELESAVEQLNDYASGNVWGFEVKDQDGEEVESVWGFLGDYDREGGALYEARGIVDSLVGDAIEKTNNRIADIQKEALSLSAEYEALGAGFLTIKKTVQERIHVLAKEETAEKGKLAAYKS